MCKVLSPALFVLIVCMSSCQPDAGVIKGPTATNRLSSQEVKLEKDELQQDGRQYYDVQLFSGQLIHATGDIQGHKKGDTVEVVFDNEENWIIEKEDDLSDTND